MSVNVEVAVRNGDLNKALRYLKKACANEHVIADMRRGEFYRKPSEARRIRHLRALNRQRQLAKRFG
jgi:ribosomal protein S21